MKDVKDASIDPIGEKLGRLVEDKLGDALAESKWESVGCSEKESTLLWETNEVELPCDAVGAAVDRGCAVKKEDIDGLEDTDGVKDVMRDDVPP